MSTRAIRVVAVLLVVMGVETTVYLWQLKELQVGGTDVEYLGTIAVVFFACWVVIFSAVLLRIAATGDPRFV
ncbi:MULTISPECIES: hypothetical protein [Haloprofundus]|uniref:hypothetical protein n=1 Tax=Haloprofundus TaxID=1911573 RepID=UPI0010BF167A|nr:MULTISPECIES: hypothetical protein [Haloprofundus]QCJ48353.1 hypothetical protein FCF25_14990 [Haloprofundus sp. MHR1]